MGWRTSGLVSALLLAGCSGPIETRVSSEGKGIVDPATIMIETSDAVGLVALARANILDVLAKRGFTSASDGQLQLDVALSERNAAIAVSTGSDADQRVTVPAKSKRAFQSCADKEYRLAIVLTRISDGVVAYRGTASEYHCNATLNDVLPLLAERAIADLAAPKGAYRLSRSGLD
jgi:hypothetical protein